MDGQFNVLNNTDGELRLAIQQSAEKVNHAKTAQIRETAKDA